jgi:hypothetical protein
MGVQRQNAQRTIATEIATELGSTSCNQNEQGVTQEPKSPENPSLFGIRDDKLAWRETH